MAKIVALDIGDAWVGSAISDSSGLIAKPYITVAAADLIQFLQTTITKENVGTIVIGYPKTMRGTESAQTKKVVTLHDQLKDQFPAITFVLWDERLSSKRAETLKKDISKEEKLKSHSRAAAFILDTYLMFKTPQHDSMDE